MTLLKKGCSELIDRHIYGLNQDLSAIYGGSSTDKVVFSVDSLMQYRELASAANKSKFLRKNRVIRGIRVKNTASFPSAISIFASVAIFNRV